ncbi:MAG: type II toxin-antitoxin system HicB family antitoxin [Planctomycetota bacterium]|nr:type II toxin-antitoxin system HicB family antitoxin [Planctomycetota bacterium]
MCARSKNSTDHPKVIDRPFDRAVLAKARAITDRYKIILECEDGLWYGHGLEMPTAFGDGATPQAAVADTREALVTVVAYLLETGQPPPAPAREGKRSVQVNVRLTCEEKVRLETKAKAKGFRGLSEFIRTSALAEK